MDAQLAILMANMAKVSEVFKYSAFSFIIDNQRNRREIRRINLHNIRDTLFFPVTSH